jgi:hypothetical protein
VLGAALLGLDHTGAGHKVQVRLRAHYGTGEPEEHAMRED